MCKKLLLGLLFLSPVTFYFFLRDSGNHIDIGPEDTSPLTPDQEQVLACMAIFPGQAFPAAIPWEPMRKIGQQETATFEKLAKDDPLAFLERCLQQYEQEVHGYICVFDKQERVKGQLRQPESILVHFSEKHFCVHMDWIKGAGRLDARRALYVKEQDANLLYVRIGDPSWGPLGILPKALTDPQVTATSRFGIDKFGMYIGAKDTVVEMRRAKENNTLHVKYEGKLRVPECGNRLCYKFVRTPYEPPEAKFDYCNELVVFIDAATHMQVGSILKNDKGELIAYYYFHNITRNPSFKDTQFTKKSL
jgi:hypothetical protein